MDTAAGFTYAWSVKKNGNAFASGANANFTFTPDDNGTYVVALTVKDKDNGIGSDSETITVTNVPPSVAATNATVAVNQGQTAGNTGTWSDPGVNDNVVLTASVGTITKNAAGTWNWSIVTSSSVPSQTVTITATDKDGTSTSTTFHLVVQNVPLTVHITARWPAGRKARRSR